MWGESCFKRLSRTKWHTTTIKDDSIASLKLLSLIISLKCEGETKKKRWNFVLLSKLRVAIEKGNQSKKLNAKE